MKKLLVIALVGCSPGSGDDDPLTPDAGPRDGAVDAPAPGVLSPGSWQYVTYTKTADTCGNRVEGNDALTIDMVTATSFRIVWPGSIPLTSACIVNTTKYFTCGKATATVDQAPVYDAVITLTAELSGHITTTTLANGMQRIAVACTGTQCANVNATPCSVSADIVIKKVGS